MVHIVIDGYNYINRIRTTPIPDGANIEVLRRGILDGLARYKRERPTRITVVFDAYQSYSPDRHRENYKGIDVVYSREHETADDVIIGWIREGKAGLIVVTSDRAIIDEAKKAGVAFMTPIALQASLVGGKANDFKDNDEDFTPRTKSGNPRKLPKKLRRATRSISKIKS